MNWNRVKNILILFFLAINMCLFGILFYMRHQINTLPESVITATVSLLEQNGIDVDERAIPRHRYPNQNYNLTALLFNEDEKINKWLGSGYSTELEDAAEHRYLYRNQDRVLEINKTELRFSARTQSEPAPFLEDGELEELFSSELKKLGFRNDEYYFRQLRYDNGVYRAVIAPMAGSVQTAGIALSVSADSDGITEISGNWFLPSGLESFEEDRLLDVTAVMTNLIYLEKKPASRLEGISFMAYVSEDDLENKIVTAVPVYAFQFADGTTLYYNARSGEQIQ